MFANKLNTARNLLALATVAVVSGVANAQAAGGSGIDATLDAVDLSGIATKVAAAALVIVAIALAFKGAPLAKRIISKV